MTEQGARPSLATLFKQQTNVRLLAAQLARVLLRVPPSQRQGVREGRAPAGTRKSVRYEKCTRGGPQVLPDRPAFPARLVLTVSFVLSSGSDALLPPSPCGSLMCGPGWAAGITAGLDAQTPGVRTTRLLRPRTSSLGIRGVACARPRSHAKTLSAPCRSRGKAIAHGVPPCNVFYARRRRVHRCPARGS